MKPVTIFSWGYWGWGNATHQLKEVVDAVEKARGFKPPLFVDIRFKRQGRAPGFVGDRFADVLGGGDRRYIHMVDLGNANIGSRKRRRVKISNPSAATSLLKLALVRARENQRLIFFCACPWPRWDGKLDCHRDAVGSLLLQAARRTGKDVEIIEWPGGSPVARSFEVRPAVYEAIRKGGQNVPLGKSFDFSRLGTLPWGSIVTLDSTAGSLRIITGPATYSGEWFLPLIEYLDAEASLAEIAASGEQIRRDRGLNPRVA